MGIIAEQWLLDESVHLSVHRARWLRRLSGLIGRPELPRATALRFTRCRSVHGLGLTRPLDVVFVGSSGAVTSVSRLLPFRISCDRAAAQAFEFRAGEAARLGIVAGSQLRQLIEGKT